jgi:hypothetical protein
MKCHGQKVALHPANLTVIFLRPFPLLVDEIHQIVAKILEAQVWGKGRRVAVFHSTCDPARESAW